VAGKMPLPGERLREVMPGNESDFEKCDEAEDNSDAGESEADQAVGQGGNGESRHNIVNHNRYGNYNSSHHT